VAHSDGDVIYHSVVDAILGALSLPDIGQLFPDNDPRLKGSNSEVRGFIAPWAGVVPAHGMSLMRQSPAVRTASEKPQGQKIWIVLLDAWRLKNPLRPLFEIPPPSETLVAAAAVLLLRLSLSRGALLFGSFSH
jgi:hypothetical protein